MPNWQLINVAHDYARQGLTSIEEVLKLAGEPRDELHHEETLELELEVEA